MPLVRDQVSARCAMQADHRLYSNADNPTTAKGPRNEILEILPMLILDLSIP